MNPGVLSVRQQPRCFRGHAVLPCGRHCGVSTDWPARRSRVHDQGSADHHALPGRQRRRGRQEVTNPIESACQQLGQLKRVESESTRGRSVVSAVIQDRFHRDAIPQVWDELRRKINDVQPQLPPSVRGQSMVIDDFGDVYGIFLAIYRRGLLAIRIAPLCRVPPPRAAPGAKRQESRTLRPAAGSRFPRNLAAAAGTTRHQRRANLQPAPGEERRRRRRPRARGRSAHRDRPARRISARPKTCSELVIGSDQYGPPTVPQRCRHAGARRSGPAAPAAALRRQAGHRPGDLHGAGRQRRDDGRRRAAEARRAQTLSAGRHRNRRDQLPVRRGDCRHQRFHLQSGQGGHHRFRGAADCDGPQDRVDYRHRAVSHDHGDVSASCT